MNKESCLHFYVCLATSSSISCIISPLSWVFSLCPRGSTVWFPLFSVLWMRLASVDAFSVFVTLCTCRQQEALAMRERVKRKGSQDIYHFSLLLDQGLSLAVFLCWRLQLLPDSCLCTTLPRYCSVLSARRNKNSIFSARYRLLIVW